MDRKSKHSRYQSSGTFFGRRDEGVESQGRSNVVSLFAYKAKGDTAATSTSVSKFQLSSSLNSSKLGQDCNCIQYPNTPWDCHICLHWGCFGGQCRHIWQSHGVSGI